MCRRTERRWRRCWWICCTARRPPAPPARPQRSRGRASTTSPQPSWPRRPPTMPRGWAHMSCMTTSTSLPGSDPISSRSAYMCLFLVSTFNPLSAFSCLCFGMVLFTLISGIWSDTEICLLVSMAGCHVYMGIPEAICPCCRNLRTGLWKQSRCAGERHCWWGSGL